MTTNPTHNNPDTQELQFTTKRATILALAALLVLANVPSASAGAFISHSVAPALCSPLIDCEGLPGEGGPCPSDVPVDVMDPRQPIDLLPNGTVLVPRVKAVVTSCGEDPVVGYEPSGYYFLGNIPDPACATRIETITVPTSVSTVDADEDGSRNIVIHYQDFSAQSQACQINQAPASQRSETLELDPDDTDPSRGTQNCAQRLRNLTGKATIEATRNVPLKVVDGDSDGYPNLVLNLTVYQLTPFCELVEESDAITVPVLILDPDDEDPALPNNGGICASESVVIADPESITLTDNDADRLPAITYHSRTFVVQGDCTLQENDDESPPTTLPYPDSDDDSPAEPCRDDSRTFTSTIVDLPRVQDMDADGTPRITITSHQLVLNPDCSTSTTNDQAIYLGDDADNDPNQPIPQCRVIEESWQIIDLATLPTQTDQDADGVPVLHFQGRTLTTNPTTCTVVTQGANPVVVAVDANDADDQVPVPRRTLCATNPTAWNQPGSPQVQDVDNDRVPNVRVAWTHYQLNSDCTTTQTPGTWTNHGPDADDLDPNSPSPIHVVCPPQSVWVPATPSIADQDQDGLAVIQLREASYTLSSTCTFGADGATRNSGAPIKVDPNDADPTIPRPPTGCQGTYTHPSNVQVRDADQDGVGRIWTQNSTMQFTQACTYTSQTSAWVDSGLGDPKDNDPGVPGNVAQCPDQAIAKARNPRIEDRDNDGHSALYLDTGLVHIHPDCTMTNGASQETRFDSPDPNDADPNSPAPCLGLAGQGAFLPTAYTTRDIDQDGIQSYTVTMTRFTVGQDCSPVRTTEVQEEAPVGDPDDEDPMTPVGDYATQVCGTAQQPCTILEQPIESVCRLVDYNETLAQVQYCTRTVRCTSDFVCILESFTGGPIFTDPGLSNAIPAPDEVIPPGTGTGTGTSTGTGTTTQSQTSSMTTAGTTSSTATSTTSGASTSGSSSTASGTTTTASSSTSTTSSSTTVVPSNTLTTGLPYQGGGTTVVQSGYAKTTQSEATMDSTPTDESPNRDALLVPAMLVGGAILLIMVVRRRLD